MDSNLEYFNALQRSLAGGVHYNFKTNAQEHLHYITRGEKSRLWDLNGKEYLDLYAKFGAMIVGHSNDEYNNYLKSQIDKALSINHSDLDLMACDLIKDRFPSMEQIRFCLSGTEAVQNSIRLARAYTGRTLFVRMESHYHGNSDNIMGGQINPSGKPYPVEFSGDPRGTKGRHPSAFEEQSLMVRWNDVASVRRVFQQYHNEIAALILEPILVNAGGIAPAPGFLAELRTLCDQYGVVLIFDEIITGLRVSPGGAQQLYDVIPDITVLGKAVSGGVPVSIIGGKQDIFELYANRSVVHAGTFNGYPLGMASIIATINILSADSFSFYQRAENQLQLISDAFSDACNEYDIAFQMSAFGSLGVYNCQQHVPAKPEDIDYLTMLRNSILFRTLPQFGILVSPISRLFINVQFSESDLDWFATHIRPAIAQCRVEMDEMFGDSGKRASAD